MVAQRYSLLIDSISGINRKKSIVSLSMPICIEYAKRIFVNGIEITGLKFTILKGAASSVMMIPDLLRLCNNRSWSLDIAKFEFPSFLSNKGKELLSVLMFYYFAEAGSHHTLTCDGKSVTFTKEQLIHAVKQERVKNIYDKKAKVDEILCANKGIEELFTKGGVSYLKSSIEPTGSIPSVHP